MTLSVINLIYTRIMNKQPVRLYYHPLSRAENVIWMLEELGQPYELEYVDVQSGAQQTPEFLTLNLMGKLPVVVDGDTVVTESAAIGLYLADRYGLGSLAPQFDDPARGTYLRWSLFAPSVMEPCAYAKAAKWDYQAASAGWGTFEAMLSSAERAVGQGPWLLADRFTMADVIFGGTVRSLLRFGLIEARPALTAYANRLSERPAAQATQAKNAAMIETYRLQAPTT